MNTEDIKLDSKTIINVDISLRLSGNFKQECATKFFQEAFGIDTDRATNLVNATDCKSRTKMRLTLPQFARFLALREVRRCSDFVKWHREGLKIEGESDPFDLVAAG